MEDLIFTTLVLGLGLGIHQAVLRAHPRSFEQRLLNRSFLAHVAAGFALILVYRYYYANEEGEGTGDLNMYHRFGAPIADALRYDFGSVFPEVWSLFLHRDYMLPLEPFGTGSTGTMQAVAVALFYVLGNSLFAATTVIAVGSYLSKVMIYRALRSSFPEEQHDKVLLAISLSPTGVVWTCAMLKEPILMLAFGPMFVALKWVLDGRRLAAAVVVLVISGAVILLIKPYVIIAAALAAAVWFFWARTLKSDTNFAVKPLYFVLAAAVVVIGFAAASAAFPSLSPDQLAESIQYQRRAAATSTGGSNFYLEGPGAPMNEAPQRGIISQLGLVPLALITALFRPFIFESFSAMQFLNAIEMTWLTWLAIQAWRRNRFRGLLRRVTANPALMFCLTFVLVLAMGTGLSTANLGTLSRYRAPMMPFFLLMLLVLREPETTTAPAAAPTQDPRTGFKVDAVAGASST
ncbi:MAG: hypothetical protein U0228_05815 [Myxococcaceae bacterium]